MAFKDFVDYAVQNGLSVIIICYFLFKDYKQTNTIISLMCELKNCISEFKELLNNLKGKEVIDNGN